MTPSLLETALAAQRAGLSVHPSVEDGTKAPLAFYPNGVDEHGKPKRSWLHPPDQPPDEAQIRRWYGKRQGIGLRTGGEGRGLECFEFDERQIYDEFVALAQECGLGDLVRRIEAGYCEETPGPGIHWLYFVAEERGPAKLATEPGDNPDDRRKVNVLIETRGKNGFIIIAPSGGSVHPSGRPYRLISGGVGSIVDITAEERDSLWELARSFDRMPRPTAEARIKGRPPVEGLRPGDDFEQAASWDDILGGAGWTRVSSRDEETYWRRPGKATGTSATTNYRGSGVFRAFSTSTVFDTEKTYTKFGVYAILHHGGNFSAASRELHQQGYGTRSQRADRATPDRSGNRPTGSKPTQEDDDEPEGEIVDLWPVIDPAAFHGIAGEIVWAADPHTEADPIAVLVQILVGFANAIGRGPHWCVGATVHHLCLFAALVGATASGRKGSSWDISRYFLEKVDKDWARHRISSGLSSGEGLVHQVRDKLIRFEKDKEITVDEGVSDKRLLLVESELARTFKVMGREGSMLSSVLRQVWDCNPVLSVLSKNTPERATGSHISIIGHITKYELTNLLSKTDSSNGLGNRFFWVCVRRSKELPDGGRFYKAD